MSTFHFLSSPLRLRDKKRLLTRLKLRASISMQYNSPDKVMSRYFCRMSRYFSPNKTTRTLEKNCHLLTKRKIDKHTLTQDHYTLPCFLVFSVFVQSILIKSFVIPSPLFCCSMQYTVFKWWQSTAYWYILAM